MVEGGLGGCLDPAAIGPYSRSRVTREEKTARRRNRGPARSSGVSTVKNTGALGLGFIPNRHKKRRSKKQEKS
jgi:hypothetical protein